MKFLMVNNSKRYYILVGDEQNWKTAFQKNLWGFSIRNFGSWNRTTVGDFVAFYVTSPKKRIVGFGKITKKFEGKDFFWHDEKLFKRLLWKYRIQFSIFHLIKDWHEGIDSPPNLMLNSGRRVIPKETFLRLLKEADNKWKTNLYQKIRI